MSNLEQIKWNEYRLVKLRADSFLEGFDCEDEDLNEFILDDAKIYQSQLLAVTYLLVKPKNIDKLIFDEIDFKVEKGDEIAAFFSVFNDKVTVENFDSKSQYRKVLKAQGLPHVKRNWKSYPAVKIGRLAVSKPYKHKGIGTALLDYIKTLFITDNRTGCKFITVDAYRKSLNFYVKNSFIYFSESDISDETRQMYYPLEVLLEKADSNFE